MAVHRAFRKGLPTKAESIAFEKQLSSVRSIACKVYIFQSDVDEGRKIAREIKSLNDELIVWNRRIKSVPFYEFVKKRIELFEKNVVLTDVPEAIYDGTIEKKTCNLYRKMVVVNSMALSVAEVSELKQDVKTLIGKVDSILSLLDNLHQGDEFQAVLRAKAMQLSEDIRINRREDRWNKGHRTAAENLKLLYLVLLPSIELNQYILPANKVSFADEIKKIVEPAILSWNNYAQSAGIARIVAMRRLLVNKQLALLKSELAKSSSQEQFQKEWAHTLGNGKIKLDMMTLVLPPVPKTDEELVAYDDALAEVEATVLQLLRNTKGGVK